MYVWDLYPCFGRHTHACFWFGWFWHTRPIRTPTTFSFCLACVVYFNNWDVDSMYVCIDVFLVCFSFCLQMEIGNLPKKEVFC